MIYIVVGWMSVIVFPVVMFVCNGWYPFSGFDHTDSSRRGQYGPLTGGWGGSLWSAPSLVAYLPLHHIVGKPAKVVVAVQEPPCLLASTFSSIPKFSGSREGHTNEDSDSSKVEIRGSFVRHHWCSCYHIIDHVNNSHLKSFTEP